MKFVGYIIEEHNNPTDFFLDVINGATVNIKDKGKYKLSIIVTDKYKKNFKTLF